MRPGNSCFPIWPPCKVTTTTCFADYARLDGHPWVSSLLSGNSEKCRWDHLELVGEGAFVLKNGGGLRQPNNVPLEMWSPFRNVRPQVRNVGSILRQCLFETNTNSCTYKLSDKKLCN